MIAIGSASFARRVRKSVSEGAEWDHKKSLRRRATVEELRAAVESIRGTPWAECAGRCGDWAQPLFLVGLHNRCGVTLRVAGLAAGGT